ncbi:ribonuclease Z [Staphylococcus massiliensis]|uniref:Ribonuclease Z n=1 Tax=Staphylococcus massiliensis S46 TaxID=1229783 RepID=K9B7V7_9STAP|nr:ribonuclease Z [Staphylococcus massiliensis]EKU49825.1 ribonuclease Z [Staphylococcus massiliensis S46]MCG3398930.1 ribonuclease Z [Staphylococcus massiliensis]MCG3401068.1 ribonuclease Z [Staphylococcus massiliensis]MCG3413474.1 ribonuclease Z [Staphylococcus massiliensis]POA01157.1 ribonuclease Z [Staphylococcus massiliensis CCUG 55927]
MELVFFGTSAGLPTKERNTQSVALKLDPYQSDVWLFDVGEATQHQILHHSIKLGKVSHIFITHMHGDHIFGLPGVLTSRSFQGGEDKPLTIIGPKGIKSFVEMNLKLSQSHLNYPIDVIELDHEMDLVINEFQVTAKILNHGIPSYGFRIEAPSTVGKLDVEKLREIGMEPGPLYQQVKSEDTFSYNGEIYHSRDFRGPSKKGPVISVLGDTKPCSNEDVLVENADVMVHEATFLDGDKTLAQNYHHSHIDDVFELMQRNDVKYSCLTHISNRYTIEDVEEIEAELKAGFSHDFRFVKDFDAYTF